MKDCWQVLSISKTNDVQIIKNAYRNLVKKYHPDKVQTPENKRKHTIKCQLINEAYKEAIRQAGYIASQKSVGYEKPVNVKKDQRMKSFFTTVAKFLGGLACFLVVLFLIDSGGELINLLEENNPIRILITTIVILFVGILLFGFVFSFIINLFVLPIVQPLFNYLLRITAAKKHEDKLLWLQLVLINTLLFFFTSLGDAGLLSGDENAEYYNLLFRITAAYSLPALFLYDWLRDIIKFHSIKDKSFLDLSKI